MQRSPASNRLSCQSLRLQAIAVSMLHFQLVATVTARHADDQSLLGLRKNVAKVAARR